MSDDELTLWYQPNLDVFLNRWFANYDEARKSLEAEGGYLLPYRHQYMVCEAEAIRVMGLDPEDADWEKTGWDCARPADKDACQRLTDKREKIVSNQE
jgi:hypothetical protein